MNPLRTEQLGKEVTPTFQQRTAQISISLLRHFYAESSDSNIVIASVKSPAAPVETPKFGYVSRAVIDSSLLWF